MPHDSYIERNLPERGTRIGVGCQQDIRIGFNEHPNGQFLYAQHYLSRGLVLPVEYLDPPAAIRIRRPPRQGPRATVAFSAGTPQSAHER